MKTSSMSHTLKKNLYHSHKNYTTNKVKNAKIILVHSLAKVCESFWLPGASSRFPTVSSMNDFAALIFKCYTIH